MRPVWTPEDTVALRQLADEYPREVGESEFLADIIDSEGLGR